MILQTRKFGEVEVNEENIFNFVEPIIGYEEYRKFALIDYNPDSPFKWLQCIEVPDLSLPVTVPAFFNIPYEFTIDNDKEQLLEATCAEEILCLNIANVPNGAPQNTTINLLAPIVINTTNKKALQLVLSDTKYEVKYRIFRKKDN